MLMNRIRNRLISWLLAASIALSGAPATASAEVLHKFESTIRPSATSGQWVNPQYEGVLSAPKLNVQLREEAPVVTIDDVCNTLEEASAELRQGMVERKSSIAITFSVDAQFDATQIWNDALKHTGNPKEGDYLLGQLRSYGFSAYYNELGEEAYFTYIFKPGYLTTAQQEQEMDTAVAALLQQLNLAGATEYEKIKGIYDWICSNVTYDYDNLNNKDYYLKHSAYAAMIHGKAVCQGFAVLFYRLALELGVDCRYITGIGNGGSHAWNIVRLGSLYFNLDATWDQPLKENGMDYQFFLRCGSNFTDHSRDDTYAAAEFYQQYPMSPEDYGTDVAWPVSGTCGDNLTWRLEADGTMYVNGTGNMADFYADDPQWQQYAYHIQTVIIGEEVQSVGAFAFYYCANLKSVQILGSTVLGESSFSYCSALEQVQMNSVLAIGDAVFYGCNALKAIHLPASLQSIGNEVFYDCILLQNITVDPANSNFTAKDNVLFNKEMTRLYTAASMMGQAYSVPEGVKEILPYAFRGNAQLQLVILPNSVTELPEGVFYGCTGLKSVTFGNQLRMIGPFAFYGCSALTQLELPAGLTDISDYAFGNSGLEAITIPASVSLLGHGAFDHSKVTKITFTGPAPQIGDDAFGNVFADVYYPSPNCDSSWDNMTWDYGGFLQWYPTDSHSYKPVVTPADCENGGYTTYTCGCGHSYVADQTEPAGHSWDEGTVTQYPTDTTPGKRTYTCIACNKTMEEEIAPTTHEHQYTPTVTPPTCTTDGYTTHRCSACGDTFTDSIVPATGHSMGEWEQTKAPGCEDPGEETRSCGVCGEKETKALDAVGHKYTDTVAPPTCTEDGFTTHTCSVCGHSYKDTVVPAHGHTMGDWQQTKAPACEVPGEETSSCSVCGFADHRSVDALQHGFTAYVSGGNATCTADGTKTATCDRGCGKTHTVTDEGSRKPHEMGQWQTVTEATEKQEGLKRRKCLHCDHQEEETIPVLPAIRDITSDVYVVSGETIGNIAAGTKLSQFLEGLKEKDYVQVLQDGNPVDPERVVATGMEVRLVVNGQTVKTLTIVVTGDINGDGTITLSDMLMIKSHILGKTTLSGAAALAADTNDDKALSITDFLQIKAHILGKNTVKPHG